MLRASRWTRYGHDRVYVTHIDGTKIGFIDLKTGKTTIERPEWTAEFHEIVGPYLRKSIDLWAESVLNDTDVEPRTTKATPTDLAANRPGQGTRQEANQHLADMRQRSRLGAFLARALDVNSPERSWRKGAEGEEFVGTQLNRLYEHGWGILHSLPIGHNGSDIDHLLIGPGGVFPVNTKNHPGKRISVAPDQIRVNGQPVPYLRNSRFEARRVGEKLSARVGWPVHPRAVLVLLTGSPIPAITFENGGPQDVWVLGRPQVPQAFVDSRPLLPQQQINELFAAARRSDTWMMA